VPVIEAESEFEPVILPVLIELVMLILPDPVEEAESVPVDDAVLEPVEEAELLPLIEEEAEAVSLPLVGVEEPVRPTSEPAAPVRLETAPAVAELTRPPAAEVKPSS